MQARTNYETLRVRSRRGAVWIQLDRPTVMNALNRAATDELEDAVAEAVGADPVAIVFTGSHDAFCAGADLNELGGGLANGGAASEMSRFERVSAFFRDLSELPLPLIAAINGVCVAGGFELMLACDLAVATESARIGDGHANYGLLPAGGSTVRLTRIVGERAAMQLLLTGELIDAREALRLGLLNSVVPDADLDFAVDAIIDRLADKGPDTLTKLKRLVRGADRDALELGYRTELDAFREHLDSDEAREGLAAFAGRRGPQLRRTVR